MRRARLPVSDYSPPGLEVACGPFTVSDRDELERSVGPVRRDDDRFAELIEAMNRSVALWRIERQYELEPTARQVLGAMHRLATSARALADALAAAEGPSRGDGDDPLAGYESDLAWAFEDVYARFAHLYAAEGAGKDIFNGPDEAFAQLLALVPVLAGAAEAHCQALGLDESGGRRSQAGSANHRLLVRLVPVYEELFGRDLGRSNNDRRVPGSEEMKKVPTGPALGFFKFVFARLLGDAAPKPKTISTWLQPEIQRRSTPG